MNKNGYIILEGKNVQKTYKQTGSSLHVLKGIDLKIIAGEMISIVGPSGAGKSTLLHILGGLDEPTDGDVVIDGEHVYKLNDADRSKLINKKIGFVFQFYHLLPDFTALENVMLPLVVRENKKISKDFEEKASAFLEQVGLKERMRHRPNQLSGGEQQRVAIARALINEPRVIFCDEPTGNLDSETGTEIIRLLMDLNQKNQQTLVIVSHDENLARQSHRKITMRDGLLVN